MGRGSLSGVSPSVFRPFLPATVDLRLEPMGRWELGSTCSRIPLGDLGILFIGLGFAQGTGVPRRNFPLDRQFLKGAETPEVTRPFVSRGQEGQAQTKIFFTFNLLVPQ